MLPLLFPMHHEITHHAVSVLAADVGGTTSNLALIEMKGDQKKILKQQNYPSQKHQSMSEIIKDFLKNQPKPDTCCIGVAGPVFHGSAKPTNLSWEVNSREIIRQLGLPKVHLINDLEATAFGLAMLTDEDVVVIHQGSTQPSGNAAILAPGTGLGESGIYFDGTYYHPFASEGGHCEFPARDKFDFELYKYLQKKHGYVSNERLICGPGIVNIYEFLTENKNLEEPAWVTHKIDRGDSAAEISKHIEHSPRCHKTMRLFIHYLAREAANLALKMKATGGLFIGGGIAPQIVPLFHKFQFNDSFVRSGRMNYLLKKVPVRILLNPETALLGAAYYGATR